MRIYGIQHPALYSSKLETTHVDLDAIVAIGDVYLSGDFEGLAGFSISVLLRSDAIVISCCNANRHSLRYQQLAEAHKALVAAWTAYKDSPEASKFSDVLKSSC